MSHRCLFFATLVITGFGSETRVRAFARGAVVGPSGCPTALDQVELLANCIAGPLDVPPSLCETVDLNIDERVDLRDAALFWSAFDCGGPNPVCGNGTLETGEQCDDGNTVDGDGCSASCQVEPGGLANDNCDSPTTVTDGATPFNNLGATDDGPDEPGMCTFFGDARIPSDVWFGYTASCSGEVVLSLCGSDFDSKMAVYAGSACPTAEPAACSDDDCGPGATDARVTFQAVAGEQYLIRIGGFEGAQGDGTLSIRCGVDVCAAAAGDCFAEHGNAGCSDATCCNTTCDTDPFCCDVTWDSFCAGEAAGLCTGSFPACVAGAGACDEAHDTDMKGCDGVDCCNTVCMDDPFCCITEWDDICAANATGVCGLTCGGTSGSCLLTNGSAGCEDTTCCQDVCVDNPFCCDTTWDQACVDDAAAICP